MPSENGKEIFLRTKQAILKELHETHGVPKIAEGLLKSPPERKLGRGRFSEVFEVAVVHSNPEGVKTELGIDVVAVRILKEYKVDQLLASFPPAPSVKSKKQRKKQEEERMRFEANVQGAVERLLDYYKRECVIWYRCSGDNRIARENNFVELLGLVESYQGSQMPVFISRYISEGSIISYIKNSSNTLSDRERILIVSDVAKALRFLHCLDIVHRDIKGRNILIENTGERFVGLLADFGSSKVLEEVFLKNVSSTMEYARWTPPEYIRDSKAQHNEKGPGDIWALGCTLLEILQEQEPWKPLLAEAYKAKLTYFEYPIRGDTIDPSGTFRHVKDEFYDFMKKCWQKKLGDRISAEDAFVQLLELAERCGQ